MVIVASLVLLLPCGLALTAAGFARAQSTAHGLVATFLLCSVALIGFWSAGFAVQTHGALFLRHTTAPAVFEQFLFSALVAAIAAAIPAGTLAERWRFPSMMLTALAVSTIIYPLVARWVWGGGWLAALGTSAHLGHGVVDYAGSGVVHLVGGLVSLAGAAFVGPRAGKFAHDGTPRAIPGHQVPMFMTGSLLLSAGWLGLILGVDNGLPAAPLGLAAINTLLAAAASVLSASVYMWWQFGALDPSLLSNALVAGLVSMSAGCAFVPTGAAVLVGCVSGPLVIGSVLLIERTFHLDDPAGAVSIHGTCGAWGLLAVGLFADGQYGDGWNHVPGGVTGLFYGDLSQLTAQAAGAAVVLLFVAGTASLVFWTLDRVTGNRVDLDAEMEGLDAAELGTDAYPDFALRDAWQDSRE